MNLGHFELALNVADLSASTSKSELQTLVDLRHSSLWRRKLVPPCARFRLKRLIGLRLSSSQYHSLRTRRSRRSLSSGTARFSLMSRMRSVLRHKLWEVASLPRSSVRLSLARASSKPSTTYLQHSSGQIRTRWGNDRPYSCRAMIPKQVK